MNSITNILKRLFTKGKRYSSLDEHCQYRIDCVCPNSGEWKTLHCIYRLRPVVNHKVNNDIEVWIALPNETNIWNFMVYHGNNNFDFELPFDSNMFVKKHIFYKAINKTIDLYVYYELEM